MVDKSIVKFIKRHHVMTLATSAENTPYCANAFYSYDEERNLFIFTSDTTTRHSREMMQNTNVAVSIVLETRIVGRVQGLQMTGRVERADDAARRKYISRFPYAALADLTLWAISPEYIKLTDNTLGFGNKLIWSTENTK